MVKDNKEWHDGIKNEYEGLKNINNQVYDYGLSNIIIENPNGTKILLNDDIKRIVFRLMKAKESEIGSFLNEIDSIEEE